MKEFWLCGEPNEYDVGIWYDHDPGIHVVSGKPFCVHHVVDKSALDQAQAEIARLQEIISYLPKVPTQPYEKEMAQEIARLHKINPDVIDLKKEIKKLRAALERIAIPIDDHEDMEEAHGRQWIASAALKGE